MTDFNDLLKAADIVCDACLYGNDEICKSCPVRWTMEKLGEEQD